MVYVATLRRSHHYWWQVPLPWAHAPSLSLCCCYLSYINWLIEFVDSSFGGTAAASRGIKPVSVTSVESPGYDGPLCTRAVSSFSIANPLFWLDPHAYKPNNKYPITCPSHDPLTHRPTPPMVFPSDIEGIAVPPQRGRVAPSSSWWTQHGLGWWRHLSDWPSFILIPLIMFTVSITLIRGAYFMRNGRPPFPCCRPLARLCFTNTQYHLHIHHES
jgi:hypothetical protein